MEEDIILTKVCSKCKEEKPLTEFWKDKYTIDGLDCRCKLCSKEKNATYYKKNSKHINASNNEYKNKNKEELKIKQQLWYEENKTRCLERSGNYTRERRNTDILFRMRGNISNLIRSAIHNNGVKKTSKTAEILGCSFEEFYAHIESLFQEGMSWENRELWHLDHIYPVSLAESEEHLILLNHYTNFQPLWAEDNLKKSNKLPEDFIV